MTLLELAANAITAVSVLLAARNHRQTWCTGIVGCVLFGCLFVEQKLYADATLQAFFVVTSLIGWRHWRRDDGAARQLVWRSAMPTWAWMAAAAVLVTAGYGAALHAWTDAVAPYPDSAVLAFSVVAQLLLMRRCIQTWPFWLVVNSIAVPLFASRGLHLTAALYALYWLNAWHGWWHWRRQMAV